MGAYVMGIDVGGTKIACGLFDEKKTLVAQRRCPSDPALPPEAFFDGLIREVHTLLDEQSLDLDALRGIGLGMPSFILFEQGHIVKTSNLVNIRDFPAKTYLTERLPGMPIVLDNDAHVAALAENRFGAGRGFKNMLYCPISTGIATGIIINGKLFRGTYGWAGETGHMIATPGEGLVCGCGNQGCFMSWCSGSMIIKHIQSWIAQGAKTLMTDLAGDAAKIDCFYLEMAYDRGDPLAQRALDQMARYLGLWFFNLYMTFNIDCFVLGGGLLKMGEKLLDPVRRIFDSYNRNEKPVYFKPAELEDRFGIIGAAELIFEDSL
ncbi:MAG: ROK family protein [Spirochaetaceae bacterium]|jgi:glucokinase|nr:ROK family protein [Spirochaetaceae bacterium]